MTHLEHPLSYYCVIGCLAARTGGIPLLGLPGSLFANRRDVLRALPVRELHHLVQHFIRHDAYGGIADLCVLRSDCWREKGRMLISAHDRGRAVRRKLVTVPWWSDEECECWALSGELEH